MTIAINTRLLIKNKLDGIGRFSFEVLKRLVLQNPDIEFHFIFDRPFSSKFIFANNIKPHVLKPSTRHPVLWYIWFEVQLPKLIKKIQPNLFFSPDGFASTKINHIPTVTTIHDINFEHRPEDLNWAHSLFYRYYFKKYAQLSSDIITVSHFSKQDLINTYNIDHTKIKVAYNGVASIFSKIDLTEKKEIKNRYTNGKNFFIFIGSLHKRKNIKNLLIAFDLYKEKGGENKLIIIGEKKWQDRKTKEVYKNIKSKEDVLFLGKIQDYLMAKILASARALCFLSLFEGFGLPIVEAMQSNVPVITSNTSCMPEIAGDAALIVNPTNIKEIEKAMTNIDMDEKLRESLIKKGQKRSKMFHWDNTTNVVSKILQKHITT